jgi:hypothetical protein
MFLAVWVFLQKQQKQRLRVRIRKFEKGRLPDEMWCRTEGLGVDSKVWSVVFDVFWREKKLSTRRSSAKSLASNVRVRHAVKALTSATRIDWRSENFTLPWRSSPEDLNASAPWRFMIFSIRNTVQQIQPLSFLGSNKRNIFLIRNISTSFSCLTCNKTFLTMAVNETSPKYSPLLMSASTWPLPTEQVQEVQVESEVVFDFTLSWEGKIEVSFWEWAARVWMLWIMRFEFDFILLNFDARSAHVQEVQRCANRSFLDDGCTFWKWLHLKLLQCQIPWNQNAIR